MLGIIIYIISVIIGGFIVSKVLYVGGKFVAIDRLHKSLHQRFILFKINSKTNNFDIDKKQVTTKYLKKILKAIDKDMPKIYEFAKAKHIKEFNVTTNEDFITFFEMQE